MKILSHRGNGLGKHPNTVEAFESAFNLGFGIETDIRDYCGKLVISHNIADSSSCEAALLFTLAEKFFDCKLALNIKADGIGDMLLELLLRHGIKRYFAFDMSVPQMIEYRDKNINFFARQSEFEISPVLLDDSSGIWIDPFKNENWIDTALINHYTLLNKQICIVSPELHNRKHMDFWERLRTASDLSNVMLCTDFPNEAALFFSGREKPI